MKTKILFLYFLLVIFGSTSVSAQLTRSNFSIGPRVGVNFSNISNLDDANSITGLVVGLTSTYSITETSGITVDLLYSGEGYELGNNELKLNYLRIPLLYNIFFGELGASFRPKLFLGPDIGILLSAESNGVDVKDSMKSLVIGAVAGLGFNYRLSDRIWLNTSARSYFDFTDVREDPPSSSDKYSIRNIQLSLGIAYGL